MKIIRWGIIGCGNVTEVKSGPGFQKAEGSALVAVMRRDGNLARDYAQRHGVAKWYANADQLIADPDVDAVYIATPPGAHLEYALNVCAAGKPAYVEKPMARNHTECQQMITAFKAAGLPLFVAYYRRRLPRFVKAKELIASGALGNVATVSYRYANPVPPADGRVRTGWHLQAECSGGGLFLDVGCHALDIIDFLLGPLEEVAGHAANVTQISNVEDAVAMSFRTGCGAVGVAQWEWTGSADQDVLHIAGTKGELTLSMFGNEPVRLIDAQKQLREFDLPNPLHVQQPLIQTVVDQLRGGGSCPSTGVSAARTSLVMDQVLTAYYGKRTDEIWRRPETWPGRPSVPSSSTH